jgi:hypothetical protein
MTNQQIKERLAAVFNALNAVEVKGMSNITNIAGCMQVLKEILESEPEQEAEEEVS